MRTLLALAALALWPLACGEDEPSAPPPATGPLVVYAHGGGIAAMPRILEVARDGHAALTVTVSGPKGPRNEMRQFDLPARELSELEAQLEAAAGDTGPSEPTGCADCFTYSIEATGLDVELDQVSIEDVSPELRELVRTLERLSAP